jgi:uncharacterized protein
MRSLRGWRPAQVWSLLALATLAFAGALELLRLSAGVLMGALIAAVLVASADGALDLPVWPYRLAQALVGCLIARSLNVTNLQTILRQWPTFVVCVSAVILFSLALGGLLARSRVLPGTTAVWGAAPGAATVMVLMSEAYGADERLVAFMQFLRVAVVAVSASLVSQLFAPHGAAAAKVWFPALDGASFLQTLAVAVLGALLATRWRLPGSGLVLPIFLAALLALLGVPIVLPPWLMAAAYTLLGWAIGLRFTREILRYTAHAFFKVLASIVALVLLCSGLGHLLHLVTGIDPLTAYLATSPGGADSVAIIAAGSAVDLPFVTAMQTTRFLVVLVVGPALARLAARWSSPGDEPRIKRG